MIVVKLRKKFTKENFIKFGMFIFAIDFVNLFIDPVPRLIFIVLTFVTLNILIKLLKKSKRKVRHLHHHFQALCSFLIVFSLWAWLYYGFDSVKFNFSNELEYGTAGHWSTFAIYFGLAFFLSRHLENIGVVKIKNIVGSLSLMYFNYFLFERVYNGFSASLHIQMKTEIWAFLLTSFLLVSGVLVVINKITKHFFKLKLRFNRKVILLSISATLFWLLWIFYPFQYQVVYNKYFPQTCYIRREAAANATFLEGAKWQFYQLTKDFEYLFTPKSNLSDFHALRVKEYIQYLKERLLYVPNAGVHAVNVLTKFFFTWAIGSFMLFKRTETKKGRIETFQKKC